MMATVVWPHMAPETNPSSRGLALHFWCPFITVKHTGGGYQEKCELLWGFTSANQPFPPVFDGQHNTAQSVLDEGWVLKLRQGRFDTPELPRLSDLGRLFCL